MRIVITQRDALLALLLVSLAAPVWLHVQMRQPVVHTECTVVSAEVVGAVRRLRFDAVQDVLVPYDAVLVRMRVAHEDSGSMAFFGGVEFAAEDALDAMQRAVPCAVAGMTRDVVGIYGGIGSSDGPGIGTFLRMESACLILILCIDCISACLVERGARGYGRHAEKILSATIVSMLGLTMFLLVSTFETDGLCTVAAVYANPARPRELRLWARTVGVAVPFDYLGFDQQDTDAMAAALRVPGAVLPCSTMIMIDQPTRVFPRRAAGGPIALYSERTLVVKDALWLHVLVMAFLVFCYAIIFFLTCTEKKDATEMAPVYLAPTVVQ